MSLSRDEPSTGMRLNQYPAEGGSSGSGGGQPNLASTPAEKTSAAKAIEGQIEPGTKRAGDWADNATSGVVKAFNAKDGNGWLVSAAMKKAHKTWGEQVQGLMHRLGSEKVALRNTNMLLTNTDFAVGSDVQSVRTPSPFDQY
ncbi:hypothetical protein [Streptomyces chartreusis]|uniref:hypothetical protein n=1 Tax=Streptomyces chartreusis TaxID=1969 RepID=UPI002E824B05|nr:hypothetical protein [Streptomyces chartreusis]WUB18358.1 hypothetical protein OG997_17235 [Streptomyces chartreusis]